MKYLIFFHSYYDKYFIIEKSKIFKVMKNLI
jgi:hypothetical protein